MDNLQNPLFIISTLTGLIFVITAIITAKYPPKRINSIYGYRTKASMKSQERWDFAQKCSTDLLFKYGILLTIIGLVCYFTSFSIVTSTILSLIIMSILMFLLFYKTEHAIKAKFGEIE